jgi:hypothetical protein
VYAPRPNPPTPAAPLRRALPALRNLGLAARVVRAWALVVLVPLLWAGGVDVSAQATLPALPYWACGPGEPLSCYAEGLEAWPAVEVEGGRGGLSNCVDDGSGVTFRCVLWAEGDWWQVRAGGVVVAQRCPCVVWLPSVSTGMLGDE